jgi:hypothetical protein
MMMGIESNEYQQRASLETLRAAVATGDPGRVRASLEALRRTVDDDYEASLKVLERVIKALGLPDDASHEAIVTALDHLLMGIPDQALAHWLKGLSLQRTVRLNAERLERRGLVAASAPIPMHRNPNCAHGFPRPHCAAPGVGCGSDCQRQRL